jgi:hypothetical protein
MLWEASRRRGTAHESLILQEASRSFFEFADAAKTFGSLACNDHSKLH